MKPDHWGYCTTYSKNYKENHTLLLYQFHYLHCTTHGSSMATWRKRLIASVVNNTTSQSTAKTFQSYTFLGDKSLSLRHCSSYDKDIVSLALNRSSENEGKRKCLSSLLLVYWILQSIQSYTAWMMNNVRSISNTQKITTRGMTCLILHTNSLFRSSIS